MKNFKMMIGALVCFAGVSAAMASDLLVGGSGGIVKKGDPHTGNFQFYGVCGGPIDSIAVMGSRIFLGTDAGTVYVFDSIQQQLVGNYQTGTNITGLAVHNGQLLVSNSAGEIKRLNPTTGALITTYHANIQVEAMVQIDGYIYVGGSAGAIYRAPANTGNFTYFTCFCNGPINAMAIIGDRLYVMDTFAQVLSFDFATGAFGGQFFSLPAVGTAMVAEGGDLLVASAAGAIRRIDPLNGQVISSLNAATSIQAMLLLNDDTCPGDFDNDGFITGADFDAYAQAFEAGNMSADFDGDGFVNGSDFDQFVLSFEQGC